MDTSFRLSGVCSCFTSLYHMNLKFEISLLRVAYLGELRLGVDLQHAISGMVAICWDCCLVSVCDGADGICAFVCRL